MEHSKKQTNEKGNRATAKKGREGETRAESRARPHWAATKSKKKEKKRKELDPRQRG